MFDQCPQNRFRMKKIISLMQCHIKCYSLMRKETEVASLLLMVGHYSSGWNGIYVSFKRGWGKRWNKRDCGEGKCFSNMLEWVHTTFWLIFFFLYRHNCSWTVIRNCVVVYLLQGHYSPSGPDGLRPSDGSVAQPPGSAECNDCMQTPGGVC